MNSLTAQVILPDVEDFRAGRLGVAMMLIRIVDHEVAALQFGDGKVRSGSIHAEVARRQDGKGLWVNTFMDGMTRYFDLSNPEQPKETYQKHTGSQVNMISQSWDGKRVYTTSSLLARFLGQESKTDNEQFLRAFKWDGTRAHSGVRSGLQRKK